MKHSKIYEITGPDICDAVPLGVYDWTNGPYSPGQVRIVELIPSGDPDQVLMRITRDTVDDCEKEALGQLSDGFFENVKYTAWHELSSLSYKED